MTDLRMYNSFQDYLSKSRPELVEEAFKEKDLPKVARLIGKVLTKRFKEEFVWCGVVDKITNKFGKFSGIMFFSAETDKAIRFNFRGKTAQVEFESIDYWLECKADTAPDFYVDLDGLNVMQVMDKIVEILREKKIGEFEVFAISFVEESVDEIDLYNTLVEESKITALTDELVEEAKLKTVEFEGVTYKTQGEAIIAMLTKGMTRKEIVAKLGCAPAIISQALKKYGLAGNVKVEKGKEETVASVDPSITLPAPEDVTADELFENMEDALELLVNNVHPFLIITGMAGIGKCVHGDTKVNVSIEGAE